jgi:hypothetical protein
MIPIRRLATLVLPLLLLLPLAMGSSRAQSTNADPRYAFSDTTLVRDTLGLTFERLFPLADSLRMEPADLRGLSVRYQLTLARLIKLADSLGVTVDAVGPIVEKERFNIMAQSGRSANDFTYNSTYDVGHDSNGWRNVVDAHFFRGSAYLASTITENFMSRVGRKTIDRTATTQVGWNRSRQLSAGVLTTFNRTNSPGDQSIYSFNTGSDAYSFTLDSQQRPVPGLASHLHLEGGLTSNNDGSQRKNGGSTLLSGDARYIRGRWLNNFVAWKATRDLSDLALLAGSDSIPGPSTLHNSVTGSSSLNGTLGLWSASRVGINANYNLFSSLTPRASALDTLRDSGGKLIREFFTEVRDPFKNNSVNTILRMRIDADRSLDISGQAGNAINSLPSQQSKNQSLQKRTTNSRIGSDARYAIGTFRLQNTFSISRVKSDTPDNQLRGRLEENTETRALGGSINWDIRPSVSAILHADISLNIYRIERIGDYPGTNAPNDTYAQSFEARVIFPLFKRGSSNAGLKVGRGQKVNLAASSTASNTESRSYNADWQWNYRLAEGLIVTQNDQAGAIYTDYPFILTRNSLNLTYGILTTVTATLSKSLTIELSQNARSLENGGYLPQALRDPTQYFSKTRNDVTRGLTATVTYALSPSLSLNFRPDYSSQSVDQNSGTSGTLSPYQQTRRLSFNGGANMNMRVGRKGRLTGILSRNSNESRTIQYSSFGGGPAPNVIQDFWSGSVTFTWTL